MIRHLLVVLSLLLPGPLLAQGGNGVTPEWTERYLNAVQSKLLDGADSDHVMSFYYFGSHGALTLMGLERVKGDDYEQFFSLMIFNGQQLEGYYQNVFSFPSGVTENGDVLFPRDVASSMNDGSAFNLTDTRALPLCQTLGGQQRCFNWVPAQ